MVKRIAILFPDASLMIVSAQNGEVEALNEARTQCGYFNKGEQNPEEKAMFGEIEINLNSFKERF